MGTRFRKSVKIAPGLKLNINKGSVGLTAGTRGAHMSVNTKGQKTKSVGIPGTGLSYVDRSSGKTKPKRTFGSPSLEKDYEPTYRVVGVAFKNEDGSSRQEYLKEFYENPSDDVEFQTYEYEGEPAVKVLIRGCQVGNIAKDEVEDFLYNCQFTDSVMLDYDSFTTDEDKPIYTVDITLGAPEQTEPLVNEAAPTMTKGLRIFLNICGTFILLVGLLLSFAVSFGYIVIALIGALLLFVSWKYKKQMEKDKLNNE